MLPKIKLPEILLKRSFAKNVAILSIGTIFAQIIPIISSPILTRLYAPEDFGLLANYMALVSIFSVFATGQYDLAITLPKRANDAGDLIIIAIKLAIASSILLYLPIYFFGPEISKLIKEKDIGKWLFLLPISVLFTSLFNIFQYWYNRNERYKQMSYNRISFSLLNACSNISFGFLSLPGGMIIGNAIGQIIISTNLLIRTLKKDYILFKKSDYLNQIKQAKIYKNHPFFLTPGNLIGIIGQHLPIFLLTSIFSLKETGYFAMAHRLVSIPSSLIANAIGDVFRQKAAEVFNISGDIKQLYLKTLKKTLGIIIIPFIVLFFTAPYFFKIIFGPDWVVAGRYAQILIVSASLQFVITPVDKVFLIYKKTSYELIIQCYRTLSLLIAYYICVSYNFSIYEAVIVIMVAFSSTYFLVLLLSSILVLKK